MQGKLQGRSGAGRASRRSSWVRGVLPPSPARTSQANSTLLPMRMPARAGGSPCLVVATVLFALASPAPACAFTATSTALRPAALPVPLHDRRPQLGRVTPGLRRDQGVGAGCRTRAPRSTLMTAVPGAGAGSVFANRILVAAAGKAQAVDAGLQVMVSKILGYGILVGSLFLQVPQLVKILRLRSVAGISRWSRYSEVPINTSSCIYHFLIGAPLSTWGENIIVLTQNLVIVCTCWIWDKHRVAKREMVSAVAALALLSAVQLSLPPSLVPLLIWLNIPFILGSTVPQIVQNFQQGHTGQLAIATCFMKMGGCVVRLFTTITQIGFDPGLLIGYGAGASMNLTLMLQVGAVNN